MTKLRQQTAQKAKSLFPHLDADLAAEREGGERVGVHAALRMGNGQS